MQVSGLLERMIHAMEDAMPRQMHILDLTEIQRRELKECQIGER